MTSSSDIPQKRVTFHLYDTFVSKESDITKGLPKKELTQLAKDISSLSNEHVCNILLLLTEYELRHNKKYKLRPRKPYIPFHEDQSTTKLEYDLTTLPNELQHILRKYVTVVLKK